MSSLIQDIRYRCSQCKQKFRYNNNCRCPMCKIRLDADVCLSCHNHIHFLKSIALLGITAIIYMMHITIGAYI